MIFVFLANFFENYFFCIVAVSNLEGGHNFSFKVFYKTGASPSLLSRFNNRPVKCGISRLLPLPNWKKKGKRGGRGEWRYNSHSALFKE